MNISGKTIAGALVLSLTVILAFGLVATPAPADPKGQQLLNDLIAKAKKEGALDAAFVSQAGPANPHLVRAFKKRFGLNNLEINIDVGNQTQQFAQLIASLKAGVPPALDAFTGSEEHVTETMALGFTTKVDNWERLLAEINPLVSSGKVKPSEVSPELLSGHGFIWGNRVKALVYNPKLISEGELPKTRQDLANAKYKGKFAVAPWLDEWLLGMLVYRDKARWLETLDQIGKNAIGVFHLTRALERLLLGEIAFFPGNEYHYYQAKAQDPQAPIAVHYLADYTGVTRISFIVAKGARHPAAATLWALWMTTPEAEAVWQPTALYTNVSFGQSDYDREVRDALKKVNTPVISFWDSPETRKVLKWISTEEGQKYTNEIGKAVTQRQKR